MGMKMGIELSTSLVWLLFSSLPQWACHTEIIREMVEENADHAILFTPPLFFSGAMAFWEPDHFSSGLQTPCYSAPPQLNTAGQY